jgi:hypothetical protein
MRTAGFLVALALSAGPVVAQEPQKEGRIWRGTLGETAITVCFFEQDARAGVYYTDAALEPIRLEPTDDSAPQVARELRGFDEATGAIWTFAPEAGDQLAGDWRDAGQTRPISLTAVPAAFSEYGTPCESEAFLAPLLAGGETTAKRTIFEGTDYTELTYAGPKRSGLDDYHVISFALDRVRPGDAAVNQALAAALPDGTAAHVAGQCVGWSMANASGAAGYWEETVVPILMTARWLGVRDSGSSYCGGAHPNNYSGLAVYDRDSGAEVDPAGWFKPGALAFYDWDSETEPKAAKRPIAGLSEALGKAVMAHWPAREDGDECGTADGFGGSSWQIGLTREGPVFVPQLPHVIFACTEEIVLPWAEAGPFLSAEGRAVMDSLR